MDIKTQQFILKANKIHNNKYDYSNVIYINSKTVVKIVCPDHGEFEQTPERHVLKKFGCYKCGRESSKQKQTMSLDDFIHKANKKYNNKFDYTKVSYINSKCPVIILCPEHGMFEQTPEVHLRKNILYGCPQCGVNNVAIKLSKGTEDFILNAKQIFGNLYDYTLVQYKNSYTKVKILCKHHGVYEQTPTSHINNMAGCPYCNESSGEKIIRNYLTENHIEFSGQKIFKRCRNKRPLRFDFWLPEYNCCIEFDGEQHFKPHSWKGETAEQKQLNLYRVQLLDKIKNNFCFENNIRLLRIPYKNRSNITEILNDFLNR